MACSVSLPFLKRLPPHSWGREQEKGLGRADELSKAGRAFSGQQREPANNLAHQPTSGLGSSSKNFLSVTRDKIQAHSRLSLLPGASPTPSFIRFVQTRKSTGRPQPVPISPVNTILEFLLSPIRTRRKERRRRSSIRPTETPNRNPSTFCLSTLAPGIAQHSKQSPIGTPSHDLSLPLSARPLIGSIASAHTWKARVTRLSCRTKTRRIFPVVLQGPLPRKIASSWAATHLN